MHILVLNAGSSSLKFRVFRMDSLRALSESEEVLATGQIECGVDGSKGYEDVIRRLTQGTLGGQSPIAVDAVGHRIVHGGGRFSEPVIVDDGVLKDLHQLTHLAPLHNPAGIAGIEAAKKVFPQLPNIAVFDTAFHHALPAVSAQYALPSELAERLQLRRYGFHGISYQYVSERLRQILRDRSPNGSSDSRIIVCHLGNGASVCAIRNGKSIDTSMGFTPLEGLIMGTRSGDVDPGIVLHLLRSGSFSVNQLEDILNYQSGLLGLSGKSGDVRALEKAEAEGDLTSKFALDCFAYRVRKYIGAYAAVLGGVDALVFTGGIGEHSSSMRARICRELDFLGLSLDAKRNQSVSGNPPVAIDAGDKRKIWVIPTDEERQIAREVFTLSANFREHIPK